MYVCVLGSDLEAPEEVQGLIGLTPDELGLCQSLDADLAFVFAWLEGEVEPEEGVLFLASPAVSFSLTAIHQTTRRHVLPPAETGEPRGATRGGFPMPQPGLPAKYPGLLPGLRVNSRPLRAFTMNRGPSPQV